jgi:hypothetical protein
MNQENTNEQIALQWFAAFNEHNLEKLLALYDDNSKNYSSKLKIKQPKTEGWIILPTLHYQLNKFTTNKERIFMEYTRQVAVKKICWWQRC